MINPLNIIPAPYRAVAILLAWGASLVAVGWWQRHDGAARVESAWLAREAQQNAQAAARIQALQVEAREAEHRHGQALADISAHYQEQLTHADARRTRDIAALRAGALRLRDPASAPVPACGSATGQTPAAPGGRDGAERGELSGQAAEFLYRLASEADDLARQLTACQQVIRQDRE